MEVYVVTAYWAYEEDPVIVGVCDKDHIHQMKADYIARYYDIKDSIRSFEVDEYDLNIVQG